MTDFEMVDKLIIAYGGDKTLNEIEKFIIRGEHTCPQCKGDGGFWRQWREDCVNYTRWFEACGLCGGRGVVDKKYKPRMVQEGWEQVEEGED